MTVSRYLYYLNLSKLNRLILVDVFNFQDYLIISKITKEVAFFIGANQNDNENVSKQN